MLTQVEKFNDAAPHALIPSIAYAAGDGSVHLNQDASLYNALFASNSDDFGEFYQIMEQLVE